jgi:hypothetical protein
MPALDSLAVMASLGFVQATPVAVHGIRKKEEWTISYLSVNIEITWTWEIIIRCRTFLMVDAGASLTIGDLKRNFVPGSSSRFNLKDGESGLAAMEIKYDMLLVPIFDVGKCKGLVS